MTVLVAFAIAMAIEAVVIAVETTYIIDHRKNP